jgi:hypothetical protein
MNEVSIASGSTNAALIENAQRVTVTLDLNQCMQIFDALSVYERSHRKVFKKKGKDDGKWGHPDCPPSQESLQDIRDTLRQEMIHNYPEWAKGILV